MFVKEILQYGKKQSSKFEQAVVCKQGIILSQFYADRNSHPIHDLKIMKLT